MQVDPIPRTGKGPRCHGLALARRGSLVILAIVAGMLATSAGKLRAMTQEREIDPGLPYSVPAKAHPGTFMRRDVMPFVGRVVIKDGENWVHQFTCTLTGVERGLTPAAPSGRAQGPSWPAYRPDFGVTAELRGRESGLVAGRPRAGHRRS